MFYMIKQKPCLLYVSNKKKCSTLTSAAFKGLNFIDYDTVKIL